MNVASQLEKFMKLRSPPKDAKIVYVHGSFDLLNPGHLDFLEKAHAEGDYLIVGVHPDDVINISNIQGC